MQRAIYPHPTAIEYSSFASDINLVAASPSGEPARAIYIVDAGSGSLVVTTDDGENRTYTNLQSNNYLHPTPLFVKAIIASGTDVAKVRVGF